jgi:hypothetical protein
MQAEAHFATYTLWQAMCEMRELRQAAWEKSKAEREKSEAELVEIQAQLESVWPETMMM